MKQNISEDDEVKIIGGGNLSYEEMLKEKGSRDKSHSIFRRVKRFLLPFVALLLCGIFFLLYMLFLRGNSSDLPYSTSRSAVTILCALESSKPNGVPSVSMSLDSLNGVVFKLYTIKNLTMQVQEGSYPDESDSTLYFVSRAMDYRKYNGGMIGEYVIHGEVYGADRHRLAYLACLPDGFPQIGIGRENCVTDYVSDQKGFMIRQFALVSSGQICTDQFELKGKVTRAAYAWKESDPSVLYFLETKTKETLYDFSEAIVDYGFTDAIYITDGVWDSRFYRGEDGRVEATTNEENKKSERQYIVFRKISSL